MSGIVLMSGQQGSNSRRQLATGRLGCVPLGGEGPADCFGPTRAAHQMHWLLNSFWPAEKAAQLICSCWHQGHTFAAVGATLQPAISIHADCCYYSISNRQWR